MQVGSLDPDFFLIVTETLVFQSDPAMLVADQPKIETRCDARGGWEKGGWDSNRHTITTPI